MWDIMNTLDAINNRRSIRKYLDKPVEFEKLTVILDAASKAPSAGNLQDWKFILVTDRNMIKQVAGYSIAISSDIIFLFFGPAITSQWSQETVHLSVSIRTKVEGVYTSEFSSSKS